MPTKKEIYDIEQKNKDTIHLYAEGMFYRAYEKSAFFLCSLIHPFKVSCHFVKSIGDNGVEFLGAYLKPFRKYVGNECLRRMQSRMQGVKQLPAKKMWSSVNSYLGMTSHYSAYNIRKIWIGSYFRNSFKDGYFTKGILSYKLYEQHLLC